MIEQPFVCDFCGTADPVGGSAVSTGRASWWGWLKPAPRIGLCALCTRMGFADRARAPGAYKDTDLAKALAAGLNVIRKDTALAVTAFRRDTAQALDELRKETARAYGVPAFSQLLPAPPPGVPGGVAKPRKLVPHAVRDLPHDPWQYVRFECTKCLAVSRDKEYFQTTSCPEQPLVVGGGG